MAVVWTKTFNVDNREFLPFLWRALFNNCGFFLIYFIWFFLALNYQSFVNPTTLAALARDREGH